jgi:hypothetical protein
MVATFEDITLASVGESMMRPWEVPDLCQRVEVVDANVAGRAGSSNIQVAAVWVGGNVVWGWKLSSCAANW